MRAVLAACFVVVLAGSASAGQGHLKTGMFHGKFCNQFVTFELKKRGPGRNVFRGKLHVHDTSEHDDVQVEQYRDRSLKITRFLSGKFTGKRVWVLTFPPAYMKRNGIRLARFEGTRRDGFGCPSGQAFLSMPY